MHGTKVKKKIMFWCTLVTGLFKIITFKFHIPWIILQGVSKGKGWYNVFRFLNGVKQECASTPSIFHFVLEYAIRKVPPPKKKIRTVSN